MRHRGRQPGLARRQRSGMAFVMDMRIAAKSRRARLLAALVAMGLMTGGALAQDATADGAPAEPPACGTEPISIARMQWPSAAILANIHAELLVRTFGCEVQIVAGDLNATTSSMATTGRPLVAPEVWLGRVAPIWNSAIDTGHIRQAAPSFSGGSFEGWFIPDYVAADNPDLTAVGDLMDYWQVFADGKSRAKFLSCPPDWACSVINRNLLRANGLDVRFDITEPANRFELDQAIAGAVSRREPVLFYYWQPNGVLAQLGFKPLDMGAFDATAITCLADVECAAPKPSAFPSEQVVIAISDDLFALSPNVVAYFQRASLPLEEMNALLAFLSENGGTPEDAARHFVETRSEIWSKWTDF